jgi:hypothetical protein
MATLFDVFQYNGLKYDDLTNEREKNVVENCIKKLAGTELGEDVLDYFEAYPDANFCINCNGSNLKYTRFPDDLAVKVRNQISHLI